MRHAKVPRPFLILRRNRLTFARRRIYGIKCLLHDGYRPVKHGLGIGGGCRTLKTFGFILLNRMCQLVSDQAFPIICLRGVLSRPEDDVMADRVSTGVDRACRPAARSLVWTRTRQKSY